MVEQILSFLRDFAFIVIPSIIVLFVIWKAFANAAADEYITLERRWIGNKMSDGRTVALQGEIGLQARVLGPGLHWFFPFINRAMKHKIIQVGPDQMLALEAVTGNDLPNGEFFGKPVECKNFQDGEAFLKNSGQKGYQQQTLGPGEYMINPHLFKWEIFTETEIGEKQVGTVEALAGAPIAPGRIFANPVECNNFQDAEAFLKNGGQKGPQVDTLPPGKFRLNPFLFKLNVVPITVVPGGRIGLVNAVDGASLPDGRLLAEKVAGHKNFELGNVFITAGGQKGRQLETLMPGSYRINTALFQVDVNQAWIEINADEVGIITVKEGKAISDPTKIAADEIDLAIHSNFQDAAAFIAAGGQKGLQIPVLRSGNYAINPWFATIEKVPMTIVEIGECGVVTSYVGLDGEDTSEDNVNAKIVENGCKGIWKDPLGPGKHPINTHTYKVDMVPTNQITLSWADARSNAHKLDSNLKTITLRTADAFSVNMDVNVIIHIPMRNAPKVIANQGSIASLISQVLEPAISSHFRNAAQYIKALDLYTQRKQLQETAKAHIVEVLKEHFIDSKDTLIADVVLPESLTKIVTDKQIAEQEKQTYKVQREAQAERRGLENETAQANMQSEVVKSERQVEIEQNIANGKVKAATGAKEAAILDADGKAEARKLQAKAEAEAVTVTATANAQATKVNAEANAEAAQKIGNAEAEVILAKGKATAEAYKEQVSAMGQDYFGRVQALKEIKDLNFKFVPDVLINNGGGEGGSLQSLLGIGLFEKITGDDFVSYVKKAKEQTLPDAEEKK